MSEQNNNNLIKLDLHRVCASMSIVLLFLGHQHFAKRYGFHVKELSIAKPFFAKNYSFVLRLGQQQNTHTHKHARDA